MPKIFNRSKANDAWCGVELGDRVADTLSGLTGIVTARAEYLTGCNQVHVLPQSDATDDLKAGHWLDIERIELVEKGAVQIKSRPAGADIAPPPLRHPGGQHERA